LINNPIERTDEEVVTRVLKGDTECFRVLLQRHERAVFAMGMSFFHEREEASDFCQEVFLKAFRSLSGFEGRSRFSTWLYRIAYNTALNTKRANELRVKQRFVSLAEEDSENSARDDDTPERKALRKAAQEAVRQAVAELPERYRVCVDLFFFYDRSYQEIGVITGFPQNTIKSHVLRAKKLLKEKLKDYKDYKKGGF
jgi:RNA polymerase sigma-70 factor (ECF subfamily)